MTMAEAAQKWSAARIEQVRYDSDGLVPVVLQDADSGQVLTLAYANQEALQRMVETGETWLFSRSRQQLWHKGETSGHTQELVGLYEDCDADALVALVRPRGPACHTGAVSCFGDVPTFGPASDVLRQLEQRVASRAAERPQGAYTTYLFEKGLDKILKKVGEETAEVIIAAKNRDHGELRYEAADLIYHLLVLLREQNLDVQEVLTELQARYDKGAS